MRQLQALDFLMPTGVTLRAIYELRREVGVLSAHHGSTVEVELFRGREAWYLAFWPPLEGEPKNYRLRMWVVARRGP